MSANMIWQAFSQFLGGRNAMNMAWEKTLKEMASWASIDPASGKDEAEQESLRIKKQTGIDMAALEKTYIARCNALYKAIQKAEKELDDKFEYLPEKGAKEKERIGDLYLGQVMEVQKHVRDLVEPRWHRKAWEKVSGKKAKKAAMVAGAAKLASDATLKGVVAGGALKTTAVVTLLGGSVTPLGWIVLSLGALDKLLGTINRFYQKGQKELDYNFDGPLQRLAKVGWKKAREMSQKWKKMDAAKSLADRQQWEKTLFRVIQETQDDQQEYCQNANEFEREAHETLQKVDKTRMEALADLKALEAYWRTNATNGGLSNKGVKKEYDKYVASRPKVLKKLEELEAKVAEVIDIVTKINASVNKTVKNTSDQVGELREELAESQKVVTV